MTAYSLEVQFHHAAGAYTFARLAPDSTRRPGDLSIEQGGDVPLRDASVGIGMSTRDQRCGSPAVTPD